MTFDPQVSELNDKVKTTLKPSRKGVGLFALRPLGQFEKLYSDAFPKVYSIKYEDFDELGMNAEVKKELLEHWPSIINGSKFAYPFTKLQAFINHSEKPNYNPIEDEVLKNIKVGEEITMDYRLIPNSDRIYTWLNK